MSNYLFLADLVPVLLMAGAIAVGFVVMAVMLLFGFSYVAWFCYDVIVRRLERQADVNYKPKR